METRLKSLIRTVIRKNTSKLNEDLDALIQKLPPGIITEATKLANVNQNEGDLVLKQMRAFMTNRVGKKNEIEWQDFVVSNFDHFKDEEMNNSGSSRNKSDVPANPTTEEESVADEYVYRTCTVSLNKVSGFDMTTIIPSEFQMDLLPKHTITPIAADISQSPALVADFNQLFQEQHLNFIHSRYFGLRGVVEKIGYSPHTKCCI
jgi:hypothetical protein